MPIIIAIALAFFVALFTVIPAGIWTIIAWTFFTLFHMAVPTSTIPLLSTVFFFLWKVFATIGAVIGFFVGLFNYKVFYSHG